MGKDAVVSGVTLGAVEVATVSRTGPGGRSIFRGIWKALGPLGGHFIGQRIAHLATSRPLSGRKGSFCSGVGWVWEGMILYCMGVMSSYW
jgi:hypothetical protein